MHRADRTTKILLIVIAIFLGLIAARPWLSTSPRAHAQYIRSGVVDSEGNVIRNPAISGHRVSFISQVTAPEGESIDEIFVIDAAHSFGIRYGDVVNIYRIDQVTATPSN